MIGMNLKIWKAFIGVFFVLSSVTISLNILAQDSPPSRDPLNSNFKIPISQQESERIRVITENLNKNETLDPMGEKELIEILKDFKKKVKEQREPLDKLLKQIENHVKVTEDFPKEKGKTEIENAFLKRKKDYFKTKLFPILEFIKSQVHSTETLDEQNLETSTQSDITPEATSTIDSYSLWILNHPLRLIAIALGFLSLAGILYLWPKVFHKRSEKLSSSSYGLNDKDYQKDHQTKSDAIDWKTRYQKELQTNSDLNRKISELQRSLEKESNLRNQNSPALNLQKTSIPQSNPIIGYVPIPDSEGVILESKISSERSRQYYYIRKNEDQYLLSLYEGSKLEALQNTDMILEPACEIAGDRYGKSNLEVLAPGRLQKTANGFRLIQKIKVRIS